MKEQRKAVGQPLSCTSVEQSLHETGHSTNTSATSNNNTNNNGSTTSSSTNGSPHADKRHQHAGDAVEDGDDAWLSLEIADHDQHQQAQGSGQSEGRVPCPQCSFSPPSCTCPRVTVEDADTAGGSAVPATQKQRLPLGGAGGAGRSGRPTRRSSKHGRGREYEKETPDWRRGSSHDDALAPDPASTASKRSEAATARRGAGGNRAASSRTAAALAMLGEPFSSPSLPQRAGHHSTGHHSGSSNDNVSQSDATDASFSTGESRSTTPGTPPHQHQHDHPRAATPNSLSVTALQPQPPQLQMSRATAVAMMPSPTPSPGRSPMIPSESRSSGSKGKGKGAGARSRSSDAALVSFTPLGDSQAPATLAVHERLAVLE